VSDEGVSHGRETLIPSCGEGEGISGEIPKDIYGFVDTGVDVKV
jgi:hypothetical protein